MSSRWKHRLGIALGPALAAAILFADSSAGLATLGLIAVGYLAFMVATEPPPS